MEKGAEVRSRVDGNPPDPPVSYRILTQSNPATGRALTAAWTRSGQVRAGGGLLEQ
jgi:hypothetical protein